jgi:hypothetical protein
MPADAKTQSPTCFPITYYLEDLGADRRLPAHDFGELAGRDGVMQSIYLSTDLGQIAEYNRREHRAKFSTEGDR